MRAPAFSQKSKEGDLWVSLYVCVWAIWKSVLDEEKRTTQTQSKAGQNGITLYASYVMSKRDPIARFI